MMLEANNPLAPREPLDEGQRRMNEAAKALFEAIKGKPQPQEPLMAEQAPADQVSLRYCGMAAGVVDAFSFENPSVIATPKQWIDLQMMIALAIKLGAEGK